MIIRCIDSDGDWAFGNGKSAYKANLLALSQNLKTKIQEWVGDCFFDNDAGIDWNNRLANRSQAKPLQNEIKSLMVKVDGVTDVVSLDLNFSSLTRNLRLDYSIKTIFTTEVIPDVINI